MSRELQVNKTTYTYPDQGDNNWGEEASEWAEAVTLALSDVIGPNDILITSATLSNDTSTPTNIPGFLFNTAEVQSFRADYFVERVGTVTDTESGYINANFNGSVWKLQQDKVGDVGITISITPAGQVQYISTDYAGHVSTTIRFRARTIDQP